MKKLLTLLISMMIITMAAIGQYGFAPEYPTGVFDKIDLNTAAKTNVGTTLSSIGASDLGANGVLYAICFSDNNFYQIDTTDGSYTLIAAITPPTNHVWTGMAYDDATGIMYGMSSWGIAAGESSLHTIDVSNGTYTLVGTQTTATAISCIAIDDNGQMYGIQAAANGTLYSIDKTNGSVTLIGSTGVGVAGMGQGLDFCIANQTMYFTNYNSLTFENTLRTVNLTNGSTASVGNIGIWTGTIAIPGNMAVSADFIADDTTICMGGSVNFTDQSTGALTLWNWSFEGGSPATSTDQNPQVTYNTPGNYDVQLIVSDGTNTDTLLKEDYIQVLETPGQPNMPVGPDEICATSSPNYTTNTVQYATSYIWEVTPADAGTISGSDTIGTFTPSTTWTGDYTIKVSATNECGTGSWSPELQCTLLPTPLVYQLIGEGAYCEGGSGAELSLDGSETGIDYELYQDDVATGNIVAGTGSAISFGYVTDEGIYTAIGFTGSCTVDMSGQIWVHMIGLPTQAGTPEGPEQVCNDTTTVYTTTGATDADTLIWTLDPVDAGTLIPNNTEATIEWSADFSGTALLSVLGENDCGTGDPSDNLEIEVNVAPQPVIAGDTFTCQYYQGIVYTTTNNPDNTYSWEISGGTIASGAGTHEVSVDWGAPGQGWLRVTEESPEGCISTTVDYVVTIDECVGIEEISAENIQIYPNPAKDHVNIEVPAAYEAELMIRIMDLAGRTVAQYKVTPANGLMTINTSVLNNGIYSIEISNDGFGRITKRLIIN